MPIGPSSSDAPPKKVAPDHRNAPAKPPKKADEHEVRAALGKMAAEGRVPALFGGSAAGSAGKSEGAGGK